ncbi:hypothetical protein Golax_020366, partial [Gossypium laxum]|nr:hypothetical protein [Gossypium laxum]
MSFALIGLKIVCVSWTKKLSRTSLLPFQIFGTTEIMSFLALRTCKWEKPQVGVIKVNVDASVNANRTGLGIIVRDSDGFVLSDKAVFINRIVNSEWEELDGLLEGIQLAQ